MAITRAQQFRQMLEDGGMLVKPGRGKRPGYRGDAAARSTGAAQSGRADPGRKSDPGEGKASDPGVSKDTGGFAPTKGQSAATSSDRFKDVDPERVKASREEFLRANPPATLTALRQQGVGTLPFGFPGSSLFNLTRRFRDYTLGKNIDYFSDLKNRAIVRGRDPRAKRGIDFYERSADGYKEYMRDRLAGKIDAAGNLKVGFMRDADGNIISTGNDGRDLEAEQQALIAQAINPNQATTPTEETPAIDPIFFRLAADGGMIEDAPVGGIMDLETGRQMYFLGKLVKKATRAVKKIVKSPIGKAAILGGAAYFGGGAGGLSKFFGTGSFNPLRTISTVTGLAGPREQVGLSGLGKILNKLGLADFKGGLTKGGMAALIGGGVTSIPLIASLFGIDGKEDDNTIDPSLLGPTIDIAAAYNNPFGTQYRRIAADGGRIGYSEGDLSQDKVYKKWVERYEKNPESPLVTMHENFDKYKTFYESSKNKKADGGRIGAQEGGIMPRLNQLSGNVSSAEQMLQDINQRLQSAESSLGEGGVEQLQAVRPSGGMLQSVGQLQAVQAGGNNLFAGRPVLGSFGPVKRIPSIRPDFMRPGNIPGTDVPYTTLRGGSGIAAASYAEGGDVEPVAKKTMPLLDMGGQEMDLRAEGGFVPIGRMEKADDVPARLSKNEFVFTAEAVRNAGDGDVDKGAEVMYNMMKNLEDGGNVSKESQGLEGARRMFQTSKRLEEVL